MGSAYVIVYSITDCSSFDSASELRITLRRARQAENIPIILVGNKSDLVRSREVAVESKYYSKMIPCVFPFLPDNGKSTYCHFLHINVLNMNVLVSYSPFIQHYLVYLNIFCCSKHLRYIKE